MHRGRLSTVSGLLIAAVLGSLVASAVGAGAGRALAPALLVRPSTHTAGPLVLLGTSGLRWADVDRRVTPTIWDLTDHGLDGALSVGGQGSSRSDRAWVRWLTRCTPGRSRSLLSARMHR